MDELESELCEAERTYFHCEHQLDQWRAPECEHWDEVVRIKAQIFSYGK